MWLTFPETNAKISHVVSVFLMYRGCGLEARMPGPGSAKAGMRGALTAHSHHGMMSRCILRCRSLECRNPNHRLGNMGPRFRGDDYFRKLSSGTRTMTASLLCPDAFLSPLEIDAVVTRALAEDLGRAGDVTSIATIPADTPARALVVARAAGVIAGLPLVAATFQKLAPEIEISAGLRDGESVAAKTTLMRLAGPARAVLAAERTALNLLGHLSGVASATQEFVRRAAGTKLRICCTRKTTPGLRALEKYAVRCGGGFNHRFGLDDAMLIKDNHIAVAGGICAVLERARGAAGHLVKVEIEVDTLALLV